MEWVIVIMMIFLIPFVFKKLARLFFYLKETMEEKEERQEAYMTGLVSSYRKIALSLESPKPEPDYVQALLDSNKEIQDREKLHRAFEEELGINMGEDYVC